MFCSRPRCKLRRCRYEQSFRHNNWYKTDFLRLRKHKFYMNYCRFDNIHCTSFFCWHTNKWNCLLGRRWNYMSCIWRDSLPHKSNNITQHMFAYIFHPCPESSSMDTCTSRCLRQLWNPCTGSIQQHLECTVGSRGQNRSRKIRSSLADKQ